METDFNYSGRVGAGKEVCAKTNRRKLLTPRQKRTQRRRGGSRRVWRLHIAFIDEYILRTAVLFDVSLSSCSPAALLSFIVAQSSALIGM